MPLLLCPNDNSSMQSVHRSGVEFEMCPTCRGVWLDRGELEKMMELARYERPIDPAPPPMSRPRYEERPPPRFDDYGERGERGWDDDRHRGRKRRGLDIFDIFD